jgi:hypothetical protein
MASSIVLNALILKIEGANIGIFLRKGRNPYLCNLF